MTVSKSASVAAADPGIKPSAAPLVAYPGLGGKRLAVLAALMASQASESAALAVQRAIQVWNEAHKAAEPEKYADWEMSSLPEEIPFSMVAERGLLPHLNGASTVTSSKGVRKIFQAYLSEIATGMPSFTSRFQLESRIQKSWSGHVNKRCAVLANAGRIPRSFLPHLRQFQARRKNDGNQIALEEVRLFGGVPEGLRRGWET